MTSKALKTFPLAAVAAVMILFSCSGSDLPKAPDFTLNNPDGSSYTLDDFKGKMVIMNFWATWCPPCKREIPDFIELYSEYGSKGLVILGVSRDEGGWLVTRDFAEKEGINYPVVMANRDIIYQYGAGQSIPKTYIIDPKGRMAGAYTGYQPKSVWESRIREILKL